MGPGNGNGGGLGQGKQGGSPIGPRSSQFRPHKVGKVNNLDIYTVPAVQCVEPRHRVQYPQSPVYLTTHPPSPPTRLCLSPAALFLISFFSSLVTSRPDASVEVTGALPLPLPSPPLAFHRATVLRAVLAGAQIAPSPDGLMPLSLFGEDKATKHRARQTGIQSVWVPGLHNHLSTVSGALPGPARLETLTAWPSVPPQDAIPGDMSMTPRGSQQHKARMTYQVESFPTFFEAGWARRGNAEPCPIYLIMCACWDWMMAGLEPASCVRSTAGLLHAACCMLCPVAFPATQLCDRGDVGKPSVIEEERERKRGPGGFCILMLVDKAVCFPTMSNSQSRSAVATPTHSRTHTQHTSTHSYTCGPCLNSNLVRLQ